MILNPLKWKISSFTKACSPKGPNINQAIPIILNLSGTQVSLNLNKPTSSKFGRSLLPKDKYNIYEDSMYYKEVDKADLPRIDILDFRWPFYGPPFTGEISELSCVVAVIAPAQLHKDFSLFNTQDFEELIKLTSEKIYGQKDNFYHGKADWITPMNWKVLDHLGTPSVSFERIPQFGGNRVRTVLTPISHNRYLEVIFHYHKGLGGSFKEVETMIDSVEMDALADNIISSMRVELSNTAQAERQSILEQYPDQKLSEYVPPYKFTTQEQDEQWLRYRKIVDDAMKLNK